MREIKLRVWNGHNIEKPVYDVSKQYGSSKAKPYILMQYTGLKDVNDKDIYEGDVLLIGETKEVVTWRKDLAGFIPFVQQIPDAADLYSVWEYPDNGEIIGNIWENPELLKEPNVQS